MAVTKDTIWQRYNDGAASAIGALAFSCVLASVALWFSQGAVGIWFAFLGLCLALIALLRTSALSRDLLMPLFLAVGALGLGLFSGGVLGAAACGILWPLLGVVARGSRLANGIGASLCALIGLVIANSLVKLPPSDTLVVQSAILALGVNMALALAACIRMNSAPRRIGIADQAQLRAAVESRDTALVEAQNARAQNQGRAQFMAEMSHEIRTPLNAILGFADTMREGVFGPLPQAYGDYPDLIHTSGTHLLDLVSDLLDLSKIEAGRYQTALKPLRLDDVAYEGVRLSSGAARAGGVQIRHEAGPPIEVAGDARACRQIIFNLISNAIKFTPRSGRVIVRVLADRDARLASLEVEDTGVGIGPADLAKIGEPWNQSLHVGRQDAKQSRGSGLGLALVKRLTELQGGSFQITSTLGAGTRARISLPLAREDITPPASN